MENEKKPLTSQVQHLAYLALGSNLGNRSENLKNVRKELEQLGWLKASSPIYETPPWGIPNQPAFLNQVVQINTNVTPGQLLSFLKQLEVKLGRIPSVRYGPRLIDIDILLYDDAVINQRRLKIPHPRIAERAFVLVPLADLAPRFRHPISHQTVSEMVEKVDRTGISHYPESEDMR